MAEPRVPLLAKEAAAKAAEEVGLLPQMAELNVFRALLHHPQVAQAVQDLLVSLLFRGSLDARLRELLIMRLGWQTGSVYEWTQHWRVALELGVSDQDLLAVRDWRASDRFSAADRAVLAATDETLEAGAISPETWAALEKEIGDPNDPTVLIELVAAIGTWRMISSVLRSLEIPLEDGVEQWPPDGKIPTG
ncbi:MAG: carboxymuconolactone decarboxylase family protein [Myxococcota bacterium]